ncbi:hypothetical protein GCM10011341_34200 [Frigidibacter albus]|nr:hypothetical protein GCM10011341_34200 [Frigidibacter albus]
MRRTLIGFGVALLALAALWWVAKDDTTEYGSALAIMLTIAFIAAALAQGIRRLLPTGRPVWVYPLLVIAVLAGAAMPAKTMLGL